MVFFGLMFNRHEPRGPVRLGSDTVRARSILGRIERIEAVNVPIQRLGG
jgi:hypothetical protein